MNNSSLKKLQKLLFLITVLDQKLLELSIGIPKHQHFLLQHSRPAQGIIPNTMGMNRLQNMSNKEKQC